MKRFKTRRASAAKKGPGGCASRPFFEAPYFFPPKKPLRKPPFYGFRSFFSGAFFSPALAGSFRRSNASTACL